MKLILRQDILGGQFKAGDTVKVVQADNLPELENGEPAGYWLHQGKAANGVSWKDHPIGHLISGMDVNAVIRTAAEEKAEDVRLARWKAFNRYHLKPGDTVYTKCSRVSRSGMSRRISCYVPFCEADGKGIADITWLVAKIAGYTLKDSELVVGGCGMDMGFSVVYSFSAQLFGRGEKCAAWNYVRGRNGDKSPETDGGYMLGQQWL